MNIAPEDVVGAVPPYLPLKTLLSGVDNLRAHGLPSKLDRSAWSGRSGADQSAIFGAMKYLGLLDVNGNTQQALRDLTDAGAATPEEKRILASVLKEAYRPVFALDLTSATPKQVTDAIGQCGTTPSTKLRAVRFFLKAAAYSNIKLSTRLSRGMRERSSNPIPNEPQPPLDNGDTTKTKRRRRVTRIPDQIAPPSDATAMKHTIQLSNVDGPLTLMGNFNALRLVGKERELVFKIIDLMDAYVADVAADGH
jgi:hypothetical protein